MPSSSVCNARFRRSRPPTVLHNPPSPTDRGAGRAGNGIAPGKAAAGPDQNRVFVMFSFANTVRCANVASGSRAARSTAVARQM